MKTKTMAAALLSLTLMLSGCSLASSKVQSACTMDQNGAKVTLSIAAENEESMVDWLQIQMDYPIESAAELTGLDLPAQNNEAAGLLQDAFASALGIESEQVKCEWTDAYLRLSTDSKDPRGLLSELGCYPSSMKYADVLSSIKSAQAFSCQ